MKLLILGVVLLIISCFFSSEAASVRSSYTTKYDNINVERILKNERLLKNYMDCVLERGKCTKEGKELKKHIPDAIITECAKCSPKQREQAGKVLTYLLRNKRNYWNELVEKYDPEGKFRRKYEIEDDYVNRY